MPRSSDHNARARGYASDSQDDGPAIPTLDIAAREPCIARGRRQCVCYEPRV